MPDDQPSSGAPAAAYAVLSKPTLWLLAAGVGVTVGNIYICQPLLDQMALSLGIAEKQAGLVAVASQVGYALGILLILPLGDVVSPSRLVRLLMGLTALELIGAAFAPGLPTLLVASVALACTTVVPQILIPIASGLVEPSRRGQVIGYLQTGLILGILLSRTVSGAVAQASGSWRSPYVLAAILTGGLALVLPRAIPARARPVERTGYLGLLRSLPPLLALRPLRLSMSVNFFAFAAFTAFWATLSFHLAGPPFGVGPATAGLFGLYGAPGALLSPHIGRLSERFGTARINAFGLFALALAFALAGALGGVSMIALLVTVNLLDLGIQSGQLANQMRIFALGDHIRARVNALYMVATFSGGAFGSLLGTRALSMGGWPAVCGLSLCLVGVAAILLMVQTRAPRPVGQAAAARGGDTSHN